MTADEVSGFYRAALIGLVALDRREQSPRRFGLQADARWSGFRGHLDSADRLDLLLADAASTWSTAFAPATVFGLPGLAADDPFGPDWKGLSNNEARALWEECSEDCGLGAVALALGIRCEAVPLPSPLLASTRLVLAGGAAILATGLHFVSDPEMSWESQVVVVAGSPACRQLAGLVAPLLGTRAGSRVVRPMDDAEAALATVGATLGGHAIVSSDASGQERAFAQRATGRA